MLSVIVGENSSGKTLYLDRFYEQHDCTYNRRYDESLYRPIDMELVSKLYPEALGDSSGVILPNQQAYYEQDVQRLLCLMLRKSNYLLLDEIDAYTYQSDKYILYSAAMRISEYKPVIAVTHDEEFTAYADKMYTLNGSTLQEISRERMLWEIYQDEEMVKI